MADDSDAAATELALLITRLPDALEKDFAPGGGSKGKQGSQAPVNGDVLSCWNTLKREVPQKDGEWRSLLGLRPLYRPLESRVAAIPSYGEMQIHSGAGNLEAVRQDIAEHLGRWLRQTRRVLGLTRPDTRIGLQCVTDGCDGILVVAGGRGTLQSQPDASWQVNWAHQEAIVCRSCGSVWPRTDWPWLGQLQADTRLVTASEAAQILGLADSTVRVWKHRGKVVPIEVRNGKTYYSLAALADLAGVKNEG